MRARRTTGRSIAAVLQPTIARVMACQDASLHGFWPVRACPALIREPAGIRGCCAAADRERHPCFVHALSCRAIDIGGQCHIQSREFALNGPGRGRFGEVSPTHYQELCSRLGVRNRWMTELEVHVMVVRAADRASDERGGARVVADPVSYTHLRAHETR